MWVCFEPLYHLASCGSTSLFATLALLPLSAFYTNRSKASMLSRGCSCGSLQPHPFRRVTPGSQLFVVGNMAWVYYTMRPTPFVKACEGLHGTRKSSRPRLALNRKCPPTEMLAAGSSCSFFRRHTDRFPSPRLVLVSGHSLPEVFVADAHHHHRRVSVVKLGKPWATTAPQHW